MAGLCLLATSRKHHPDKAFSPKRCFETNPNHSPTNKPPCRAQGLHLEQHRAAQTPTGAPNALLHPRTPQPGEKAWHPRDSSCFNSAAELRGRVLPRCVPARPQPIHPWLESCLLPQESWRRGSNAASTSWVSEQERCSRHLPAAVPGEKSPAAPRKAGPRAARGANCSFFPLSCTVPSARSPSTAPGAAAQPFAHPREPHGEAQRGDSPLDGSSSPSQQGYVCFHLSPTPAASTHLLQLTQGA